ncbi:unnamed protein product [Alopecurus aequalis]
MPPAVSSPRRRADPSPPPLPLGFSPHRFCSLQRQQPMDQFHDGHHVWLRSRVRGTYLHANDHGEGVSLHKRRSSMNAAWAVHLYQGDGDTQYVLLHSAAYGRYLAATDASPPRGCRGFRVVQRNYDQPQVEAIRWQAVRIGSGNDILLRHVAGRNFRYLRANGRYLPWNNTVSLDEFENLSTMMQWVVEPIPPRHGMPALPGPLRARLPGDQTIRFVRASDDGLYTEEGWSEFQFRGSSVYDLSNELATRVGVSDLIMCVRAGRYGRLIPLVVNLPRHGDTIEIVVIIDGTPASAVLRHPDVSAHKRKIRADVV